MPDAIRWRSYVAIGDSLTEGLQDLDAAGEPIGWADRLAQHLADRAGAPIRYANLAIRGRLLGPILAEQVEPALTLAPDLVSIWGGGNDMLRPDADPDAMAAAVESAVVRFREAGADVLIGLGIDAKDSPVVRLTRNRTAIYNMLLVGVARRHGAHVLDAWNMRSLHDWRMWYDDRIHLNAAGHARVAQGALVGLGLTPDSPDWDAPLPPAPSMSRREELDWNLVWARDHLGPWLGRRIRRTSSGAGRSAKHPAYYEVAPSPA
ncbi:MAG: SGNH/GDSL hydrolase family protein [Propionicimonas sp.]|uniref:SGNH/GDSL hydrolase family protein n=1 Tax=Propionicimonas sp. TaxID=1955623 RepID=UPI003D0D80F3